jgi:hypothetical protein
MEEHKQKSFISNKKLELINEKDIEKARKIPKEDILELHLRMLDRWLSLKLQESQSFDICLKAIIKKITHVAFMSMPFKVTFVSIKLLSS